jgi:hypothetical protein
VKIAGLALGVLLCAAPASATPITITFSGTIGAMPLWNEWLPGFVTGAEVYGSISGDTNYNAPGLSFLAFLTLTVAGHSGSANITTGPAFILQTWVSVGGHAASQFCFIGFCPQDPRSISTFTFDLGLDPQTQTGYIFYEGVFSGAGGPHLWRATINKVAVNVPEPSTLGLLGLGLLAVIARFRRQCSNRRPRLSTDKGFRLT